MLIERVHSPSDLKSLSPAECVVLAREIRDFIVETVSVTGGHLGSNLGMVELTIALHRVFDSPAMSSSTTPGTRRTCTRS